LPKASISNLEQFSKIFLDRWIIKVNLLILIEEYNQLKRHPDEIVQQFSGRFNQIFHSMPLNIRTPPDLALLHYPRAFDAEIEFRLRERSPSTMKQMQDMAVDVEANLNMREEKRKAEEEEKFRSLIKELEEMIQRVALEVECFEHQNTPVVQKERIDIHEQLFSKSDKIFIEPYAEEESRDLLCEYNGFPSFSCLPKYDLYDDDYVSEIQISLTEESGPILGESSVQVQ